MKLSKRSRYRRAKKATYDKQTARLIKECGLHLEIEDDKRLMRKFSPNHVKLAKTIARGQVRMMQYVDRVTKTLMKEER